MLLFFKPPETNNFSNAHGLAEKKKKSKGSYLRHHHRFRLKWAPHRAGQLLQTLTILLNLLLGLIPDSLPPTGRANRIRLSRGKLHARQRNLRRDLLLGGQLDQILGGRRTFPIDHQGRRVDDFARVDVRDLEDAEQAGHGVEWGAPIEDG